MVHKFKNAWAKLFYRFISRKSNKGLISDWVVESRGKTKSKKPGTFDAEYFLDLSDDEQIVRRLSEKIEEYLWRKRPLRGKEAKGDPYASIIADVLMVHLGNDGCEEIARAILADTNKPRRKS